MSNHPPEWHEARRHGIGGSDVAAALGISKYKTQLELWGEKTGLAPSDFEGNEFTYWGTAIEDLLFQRYKSDHLDHKLLTDTMVSHDEHTCLKANVDGLIFSGSNGQEPIAIWEAKTASQEFSEVPVHYQLQVQHYMEIYDLPYAIISVLFHGNKYQEFRIDRDPAYKTDLVPKLLKFWQRVEDQMPVFEATSMTDLNIKFAADDAPKEIVEVKGDTWYSRKLKEMEQSGPSPWAKSDQEAQRDEHGHHDEVVLDELSGRESFCEVGTGPRREALRLLEDMDTVSKRSEPDRLTIGEPAEEAGNGRNVHILLHAA